MNIGHNYLVPTYPDRGVNIVEGQGVYLYDENGKKYLDFGSNYGVSIFGYGHKQITKSLKSQIDRIINLHGSLGNLVRVEAAKRLIRMCGENYSSVYFCNSGTEAIEAALKFARLTKAGSHIIAMEHSYHGKTLGALSVTGSEKYQKPFLPLLWDVSFVTYGSISAIKAAIKKETIAVILEPIQGEGGINPAPPAFLKAVRKLCNERNLLLIIDEIQAGLGRSGSFLVSTKEGISADILCLGKGLAGGIPIGATLVSKSVAAYIPLHIHTSTFGGNPLAASGILATLKLLSDKTLYKKIKASGSYFLRSLKSIKHPKIIAVRGVGLMIGVEVDKKITQILKYMQEHGVIAIPAGTNVVRFLPPFIITKKQIDNAVKIFEDALINIKE